MTKTNWDRSNITNRLVKAKARTLGWLETDRIRLNNLQKKRANKRIIERQERRKLFKNIELLPKVAIIHWVKDTPHSLTLQFIEWQDKKNAKQR